MRGNIISGEVRTMATAEQQIKARIKAEIKKRLKYIMRGIIGGSQL